MKSFYFIPESSYSSTDWLVCSILKSYSHNFIFLFSLQQIGYFKTASVVFLNLAILVPCLVLSPIPSQAQVFIWSLKQPLKLYSHGYTFHIFNHVTFNCNKSDCIQKIAFWRIAQCMNKHSETHSSYCKKRASCFYALLLFYHQMLGLYLCFPLMLPLNLYGK